MGIINSYMKASNKRRLGYLFLFFGIFIVLNFLLQAVIDTDVFWHITSGQWIFIHHQVARTDHLSWYGIKENLSWINHEWLFDLIIYCIYAVLGLKGVYVIMNCIAIILYFLIYEFCIIKTNNSIISSLVSIFSMLGISIFFYPRPQIISYCLFVIFAIFMEKRKYWSVIPIIILGVNLHGGIFPIYLILGAYYLFQEVKIKKFFKFMIAYMLAVLVNPYTYGIYLYTIKSFSDTNTAKYVTEWLPTVFANHLFAVIIVIIMVMLTKMAHIHWKDVLFALAFGYLSIKSLRQLVFLYLLVFPMFCTYYKSGIQNIYTIAEKSKNNLTKKIMNRIKNIDIEKADIPFPVIYITSFAVVIFISLNIIQTPLQYSPSYPQKAVQYLKQHPNITNIYNDYNDGGYLMFNGIKPFIDSRQDLFTPYFNKGTNTFMDTVNVTRLKSDYTVFFDKYHIRYILTAKSGNLSFVIARDHNYKIIYQDKVDFLFEKVKQ